MQRGPQLKLTQVEASRGFVARQALVDGYAPKSSSDPAVARQPVLATPSRCKDAKELKEQLTAWSWKVAEDEHQFKVIDDAKKTFCGEGHDAEGHQARVPHKTEEILWNYGKSEIIVNEMMADGPEPMDLENVGTHDAMTRE